MNKVNIFVSSTCYDLSQIRADMSDFIINLGHQPFLSEFDNFPIDPNIQTIENCINNVKKEADIFILIIIIGKTKNAKIANRFASKNTKRKALALRAFLFSLNEV